MSPQKGVKKAVGQDDTLEHWKTKKDTCFWNSYKQLLQI